MPPSTEPLTPSTDVYVDLSLSYLLFCRAVTIMGIVTIAAAKREKNSSRGNTRRRPNLSHLRRHRPLRPRAGRSSPSNDVSHTSNARTSAPPRVLLRSCKLNHHLLLSFAFIFIFFVFFAVEFGAKGERCV
jgi:hypothetical protein